MKAANCNGFSLVELIIAIAIIGILATLALPSYESQLQQVRRSDATIALTSFAHKVERHFLENGSYSSASIELYQPLSENGHYQLGITATDSSYQLTATAIGAQSSDTLCGNYSLNEQGTRNISGSGSVTQCWH